MLGMNYRSDLGPEKRVSYISSMFSLFLRCFLVFMMPIAVLALPWDASAQLLNRTTVFSKASVSIASGEKTHKFRVELALTQQQHMQGLMYRRKLAADAGMLFVYQREAPIAMWMKNTYLPLDMLFIGRDGRIVKIAERTVPLSETTISSGVAAIAVLELNAGTASRLGVGSGDTVIAEALGNAR